MRGSVPDDLDLNRYEALSALQDILVTIATGGSVKEQEYLNLRRRLLGDPVVAHRLPSYVRTCRDTFQFWSHIKQTTGYQPRRERIWGDFRPILESVEAKAPADEEITHALKELDSEEVQSVWRRALDRRATDPEAAITAARTLLESTCKHILDAVATAYDDNDDLPKLYRRTARSLNLAPDQHTEELFKQILGGCQSVIEGLGAVRNKLSDAHGRGKRSPKPAARHAELVVNLAGAMATFLVRTWRSRG